MLIAPHKLVGKALRLQPGRRRRLLRTAEIGCGLPQLGRQLLDQLTPREQRMHSGFRWEAADHLYECDLRHRRRAARLGVQLSQQRVGEQRVQPERFDPGRATPP